MLALLSLYNLGGGITAAQPLSVLAWVWAYLFAMVAVLIYGREQRRWLWAAGLVTFTYLVYSLVRVSLFTQADYNRARLPFLILVLLMVMAVPLVLIACLLRAYPQKMETITNDPEPPFRKNE